jgi:hypothetical protein
MHDDGSFTKCLKYKSYYYQCGEEKFCSGRRRRRSSRCKE